MTILDEMIETFEKEIVRLKLLAKKRSLEEGRKHLHDEIQKANQKAKQDFLDSMKNHVTEQQKPIQAAPKPCKPENLGARIQHFWDILQAFQDAPHGMTVDGVFVNNTYKELFSDVIHDTTRP